MHAEYVAYQTRPVGDPAAAGPCLRPRPIKIITVQVVCSRDDLHQGIAKERRGVVGKTPKHLPHVRLRRQRRGRDRPLQQFFRDVLTKPRVDLGVRPTSLRLHLPGHCEAAEKYSEPPSYDMIADKPISAPGVSGYVPS